MKGFDASESAGKGRDSRVVWNSAMRFWVSKRMRLSPRMGNSLGDGGSTELHATHGVSVYRRSCVRRPGLDVRVVIVERLQLGEIPIERRDIFRSYTPYSTNLKDFACPVQA